MPALEDIIWPQPHFPVDRPRSKEMKVLALGLSRSGTDSLKQALNILGYDHVHHGFDVTTASPSPARKWVHLCREKHTNLDQPIKALQTLDGLVGHCEGVTDLPTALFGEELATLHPKAKIILNYREDVSAWKNSMINTLWTLWRSPETQYLSFFHPKMYWRRAALGSVMVPIFRGNPELNGEKAYRDHCERIRRIAAGREFLEWKVQDGWVPLCRFLGKPVPDMEFPSGNDQNAMMARVASNYVTQMRRAWLNFYVFSFGMAMSTLAGVFRGVNIGVIGALASTAVTAILVRYS